MQPDKNLSRNFSRRAALLLGAKFSLLGGLAARMYYLQVVEADKYKLLADENRISPRLLPPPRGYIVDRTGIPLAVNVQNFRVLIVPEQAKRNDQGNSILWVLNRLRQLVHLSEYDVERVLRDAARHRPFVPITVRENLTWDEMSRVEVNSPDLPGISIDVGRTRHYTYPTSTAHVVGYVAAVAEEELTGDPLLELPGFRIGKNGIERQYDLALRGSAGTSHVEVNALGRVIKELSRQEGQSGQDVVLTIDIGLQNYLTERVKSEKGAAAVVMDAHNGDILALVSTPSYDPNQFAEGLNSVQWQDLVSNPHAPLTNKAIGGQYAPGSTFKVAVMAAALESGISVDHTVFCPGHVELGDRKFHCWKKHGHGRMDMLDAFKQSCDVWFYEVAKKLGVDRIATIARRLGLGERLGIDLLGEKPGLIPTKKWKRDALGQPWHQGETLVVGIGQGYVLATPLQLAVMTARVVNGGKAVVPHLSRDFIKGRDVQGRPELQWPSIGVNSYTLKTVRQGMFDVVNDPVGTAFKAQIAEAGMEMGGKTGTAQVRRISMAERERGVRKNEELVWRERDHALFVGYAPVDNPRWVVSVVVEHGGGGSKAAAPVARDALLELQKRERERLETAGLTPSPGRDPI